jgi:hypothetical protein
MFLGALAFDAPATATTDPTDAATTPRAGATSGDPTAAASAWASSRSGANKLARPIFVELTKFSF